MHLLWPRLVPDFGVITLGEHLVRYQFRGFLLQIGVFQHLVCRLLHVATHRRVRRKARFFGFDHQRLARDQTAERYRIECLERVPGAARRHGADRVAHLGQVDRPVIDHRHHRIGI